MKKITYAGCGTALLITASILQAIAGGSVQNAGLILLGLLLLLASADSPQRKATR